MKIVLAYSGGLDTTCIIPYLKEKYDAEVIAFCALLGVSEDEDVLKGRARKAGASGFYFLDLRQEFVKNFCFPALRTGAVYENGYLLATALARPLIAREMIRIASETGADAISHGCTGKGNDQVRFELAAASLMPSLKVIAPVREWDLNSREKEIDYLKEKGLTIEDKGAGKYSIDRNLWGISVECGELEDPWREPPLDSYITVSPPEKTPFEPEEVTIGFTSGDPVSVNGSKMEEVELVEELNSLGSLHGVGRIDMVENRVVGIKSREVYESPGATILFRALRVIETLVLERDLLKEKVKLSGEYARAVYDGKWFSPLRESIQSFADATRDRLSGEVRLKLHNSSVRVTGCRSDFSMYSEKLATYTEADEFSHEAAEGFIKLWGLPLRVWKEKEGK